jgi:hypothetical protein
MTSNQPVKKASKFWWYVFASPFILFASMVAIQTKTGHRFDWHEVDPTIGGLVAAAFCLLLAKAAWSMGGFSRVFAAAAAVTAVPLVLSSFGQGAEVAAFLEGLR